MKFNKLFTKELLASIPKLDETKDMENPIAHIKLFYPDFSWTWYVVEFDGTDIAYGLVDGFEKELGMFSIKELIKTKGKMGLEIERDLHWKPRHINELMK